jgi:hypothetical protein
MVTTIKGTFFWDVTPCSLVKIFQGFEGKVLLPFWTMRLRDTPKCLFMSIELHRSASQKIALFI